MEQLSGIAVFVQVAETRSFTKAGKLLDLSASAVGKSVARLEERLGVRLFHRSTRSITLTQEGAMFLERCRRILTELEAAELELSQTQQAPRGRLRISLPLVSDLVMPVLIRFMKQYPEVELDVDFTDRLVDIIEEGFDAVIRTGEPSDSRLMSRRLGTFHLKLVGSPGYFDACGIPHQPRDLERHVCLQHRFPSTGRYETWPIRQSDQTTPLLSQTIVFNTSEVLVDVARAGLGIACLPDFMVRESLEKGELVSVLDEHIEHTGCFNILWPSSRHMAPKLRVFIDFVSEHLLPAP
ncbi:LysR family transcriptional regulator [Pseudomonas sp. MAG002Y]|uniref:LysR family transcriptional regulator n=1 Tax=Pseudomonas sp. MAG002Y TaxID=2678690 RepID=UPI001C609D78|nr:LysR family transcriptional regulator [Pseudomonas sp. MAG002Y]MBW5416364.1 LysR family transcriptional regulator [Pseudomonas sp. MAG002Y]